MTEENPGDPEKMKELRRRMREIGDLDWNDLIEEDQKKKGETEKPT